MSPLVEFLLARFAEDEAVAQAAVASPWEAVTDDHGRGRSREHSVWSGDMHGSYVAEWIAARADADHITRHDPARVLADCDAKRQIVESEIRREVGPVSHYVSSEVHAQIAARTATPVMRLLALPYADHPDYDREEWTVR